MHSQPADPRRAKHEQPGDTSPGQEAGRPLRQGPEQSATQPVNGVSEPQGSQDKGDQQAEWIPVQGLGPLPMAQADKGAGETAAGAGESCQRVKWTKGRQMRDAAVPTRQGEANAGGKNRREYRPHRPGI